MIASTDESAMALETRAMPLAVHTYEETAQALGMTIDRVRTLERAAFRKLRKSKIMQQLAAEKGIVKEDEE